MSRSIACVSGSATPRKSLATSRRCRGWDIGLWRRLRPRTKPRIRSFPNRSSPGPRFHLQFDIPRLSGHSWLSACALLFVALVWFAWARKETHQAAAEEPIIRSVAVLPLTDLAAGSSEDYFADGMTEELITELGRLSSIRIISRTSIMQFKKSVRSLPEIGRQLNVDALVEGTVRRSGDRVRITARLVSSCA